MISKEGKIYCFLLLGKARVVPKTFASILKKELDLDKVEERFWKDSEIVLGYIANDVRRFKTFVANRGQQIKDNTTSGQWSYIPTEENPADSAARGLNAAQVNSID